MHKWAPPSPLLSSVVAGMEILSRWHICDVAARAVVLSESRASVFLLCRYPG